MAFRPRRLLTACIALLGCLAVCSVAAQDAGAPKRFALVIGNADYRADALPTAANDAGLVAEALAQDGFAVTAVGDADAATLRKITSLFANEVRSAGGKPLVFVYISGHGVQYGNENYVVPVDALISRHSDVPQKAVLFNEIVAPIEAVPAVAHVFAFDLAHPNTIAKDEPLPLAPGLRHVQPSAGSVYAFNAAPGMIGRPDVPFYGTYARALAEALRTPGLDVPELFARVRTRVAEVTGSTVIPWNTGDLRQDAPLLAARGHGPAGKIPNREMSGLPVQTVYWAAIAEDTLAGYQAFLRAFPDDALSKRIKAIKAVRLEAATWAEACRVDRPDAYWTYMLRYPRGPHYVDVRRRLAALHASLETPMRFEPSELGGLPAPLPDEASAMQTASTFGDAAWVPPPAAPKELLPVPPPAFYAELAPPPLVPTGALPIPAPLPGDAAGSPIGRITQPIAAPGPLTIDATPGGASGITISLASEDGLITRTTTKLDTGRRTIVQTDAADEIISWTAVGETDGEPTITQSGLGGAVLSRQVTHALSGGDRETVLTTGVGKLVAETKVDGRGRVLAVTFGTAKAPEPTFKLGVRAPVPPEPVRAVPVVPVVPDPPAAKPPAAEKPVPPVTEGARDLEPPASEANRLPEQPASPQPVTPPPSDTIGLRGESPEPKPEPSRPEPQPPAEMAPAASRPPIESAPATPMAATPSDASDTRDTTTPSTPVPVRRPVAVSPPPKPVARPAKRRPLVFQRARPPKGRRAVRR